MKIAVALGAALLALLIVEGVVRVVAPAYDPSGRLAFTLSPRRHAHRPAERRAPADQEHRRLRRPRQVQRARLSRSRKRSTARRPSPSSSSATRSRSAGASRSQQRFSDLLQATAATGRCSTSARAPPTSTDTATWCATRSRTARTSARSSSACVWRTTCASTDLTSPERTTVEGLPAFKNFLTDHSAVYGLIATAIHRSPRLERAAAGQACWCRIWRR